MNSLGLMPVHLVFFWNLPFKCNGQLLLVFFCPGIDIELNFCMWMQHELFLPLLYDHCTGAQSFEKTNNM